ncbi:MAG: DUF305 domain-containing protein [Alphaproteobacteria bacterium]
MRHILLVAMMLPFAAGAAEVPHAHHHPVAKVSSSLKKNPAVKEYVAASDVMHKAMDISYTGNADVDFAAGMMPHHQGAVDMVSVLHKYGKDAELRDLGNRIVTWQNAEIGIMKRWLAANQGVAGCADAKSTSQYKEAMDAMHKAMDISYTGDADVDFVNGMIPHHQGAIDMAWILIEHGRDPELRKISYDVIRSQEQEIKLMKNWLEKNKK